MAGGGTTRRKDAWTDYELQLLYDTVHDLDWFEQVAPLIGRSENAIRNRMSQLRSEARIVPQHQGAKAKARTLVREDAAAVGSDRLRRAIERAAA